MTDFTADYETLSSADLKGRLEQLGIEIHEVTSVMIMEEDASEYANLHSYLTDLKNQKDVLTVQYYKLVVEF